MLGIELFCQKCVRLTTFWMFPNYVLFAPHLRHRGRFVTNRNSLPMVVFHTIESVIVVQSQWNRCFIYMHLTATIYNGDSLSFRWLWYLVTSPQCEQDCSHHRHPYSHRTLLYSLLEKQQSSNSMFIWSWMRLSCHSLSLFFFIFSMSWIIFFPITFLRTEHFL